MNSRDSQPTLPTWIFIVTDLALIGAAAMIGATSVRPFSATAMLWMSLCVIVGAVVGLVPVIVHFERQKNETLDERQRALETLARTVQSSAEQISIAAGGLHEIAELAQKNLRHAEHLPQKLQEKIAEFQAQLSTAQEAEKEDLERELLALRTTESERLEAVSQRIAKSAAEWAKVEAATQQHLAGANEALAKLALATASAIGKAQAAAEQALTQARAEAARHIGEASGQATRTIETAKAAALAELDAKFAAAAHAAVERATREFSEKIAAVASSPGAEPARADAVARSSAAAAEIPAAPPAPAAAPESAADSGSPPASANEPTLAPPPKRPRKTRREEPAPVATDPDDSAAHVAVAPTPAPAPVPEPSSATGEPEPAPIPAGQIDEVSPVAPHTAEPFPEETGPVAVVPPPGAPVVEPAAPATPRKRARKTEAPAATAEEPSLALDLDAGGSVTEPGVMERVMTSDGATRLLVTAYIGIGNRLFIRGTGPGLSWEKGVPLQFVSIGKWRWETSDAATPVQFKLYKNDEVECAALGEQSLDPGHQQEVSAAF